MCTKRVTFPIIAYIFLYYKPKHFCQPKHDNDVLIYEEWPWECHKIYYVMCDNDKNNMKDADGYFCVVTLLCHTCHQVFHDEWIKRKLLIVYNFTFSGCIL